MMNFIWILYFCFPYVVLSLGWAQWEWGPRSFQKAWILKAILLYLSFFLGTHLLLVRPMVEWVWKRGANLSRFKLLSISCILISLPLVAFSYWVGEVRTLAQAQEVTLAIIPAVVLSTMIYDIHRKTWQWSLSLSFMVFFSLFGINEILNPFRTYIYLLAEDYRYEYLRAVFPALVIALYYRMHYEPSGRAYLGINTIHHAWKSSRFSQMFKSTNPRESSLKSQAEASVRD